jgi:hypothetical protein
MIIYEELVEALRNNQFGLGRQDSSWSEETWYSMSNIVVEFGPNLSPSRWMMLPRPRKCRGYHLTFQLVSFESGEKRFESRIYFEVSRENIEDIIGLIELPKPELEAYIIAVHRTQLPANFRD